ncbi:hypothetical protein BMS3Abin05_02204 [bacterium BMS3Abin05]|nr:hypothetical protein BMS3Abin05_02204 [bacterium BMS3Abin05]GBE26688.1 hypothetical protein BMS3Bbin03_00607 [bacterium BMS3Bbin03]HDL79040.1 hypothetical protein [Bacteroidota bacterium]HDZ13214.1 hypothetical protein [Bacteroidota bacterium]
MKKKAKTQKKSKLSPGSPVKISIGFLVLIVAIAVWVIFYYRPISRTVNRLNRDLHKSNMMIRASYIPEDRILQLEQQVAQLNANVEKIEKKIYPISKMPSIGKAIIRLGRRHRLKVLAMTPSYDVLFPVEGVSTKEKPMVKLPVTFVMRGRYFNLGRFLDDIPQLPFAFAVDEVHIEADPSIYPNINIQLKGYFFLLTEDAHKNGAAKT